jgi:hypothetical protein
MKSKRFLTGITRQKEREMINTRKMSVLAVLIVITFFGFSAFSINATSNATEEVYESWYNMSTGYWIIEEEYDPTTNSTEISLLLPSVEIIRKALKDENYPVEENMQLLALFSTAEFKMMAIIWDELLGENPAIRYCFDGGEMEENENWVVVDKNLFLFDIGKDVRNIVEKFTKAETFTVKVTIEGTITRESNFDIRGFNKAISPYLKHFGWEYLEDLLY